jgi:flagellar biosynthesis protein FlhF
MKLKTYVGRSLEELAPQIREELGPSAVILSQRQGLKGGVGGFFGTKSIEVLAADRVPTHEQTEAAFAGRPIVAERQPAAEIEDERAALLATALGEVRGRQTPAAQAAAAYSVPVEELVMPDFAGSLGPAEPPAMKPAPAPAPARVAAPVAVQVEAPVAPVVSEPIIVEHWPAEQGMHLAPRQAAVAISGVSNEAFAVLDELDRAGVAPDIASSIVTASERYLRPIHPDALLRDLVRLRIRAILRVEAGWGGDGQRTLAVVGPSGAGKTTAVRKLGERYAASGLSVGVLALEPGRDTDVGQRGRAIDALDESRAFDLRRAGSVPAVRVVRRAFAEHDVVLIDTPGNAIADARAREALRALLAECAIDELHAAVPLGFADRELKDLLGRLATLGANRLLPTKLDETRHIGPLVTLAARSQLSLAYLGTGPGVPEDLMLADGGSICDRILPI